MGGVEVGHHRDVPLGEGGFHLLVVGRVIHEDHQRVGKGGEEVGHGCWQLRGGGEGEDKRGVRG